MPFATIALGRLSALSVWWVRLGVLPDLIEPAHPQQNGRHERMHRTLKAEATRPHEALEQRTPSSAYAPSPRPYPARLSPVEYPAHYEVRRVSTNGGIKWHDRWVNVSRLLGTEYIGLEEVGDGLWQVYFGPVKLGRFDERVLRIIDRDGSTSRNPRRLLPMSPD